MTFKAIGEQMGFGAQRAQSLYQMATRSDRRGSDLYRLMMAGKNVDIRMNVSNRTINILIRNGIDTIEKLKALELSDAKRMRQVGNKAIEQIEWLQRRVSE